MGLFPGPETHEASAGKSDGRLMAKYEFKLPDIGEGIAEAEIVAWHVKLGDRIEEDQPLADMMTDKATVEMETPVAGKVVELAGEVGDQVAIGSVLAVIETDGVAGGEALPDSQDGNETDSAGQRTDEIPMADGAVDPTPEMKAELPTIAEESPRPLARRGEPQSSEGAGVSKA